MKIDYKPVNGPNGEHLNTLFTNKMGFIEVNPGKCILPTKYRDIGERILNFKVDEKDIWLVSFPRTGSTWAQEMIWLLGNKLDFEGAAKTQAMRSPLLELTALFSEHHTDWLNDSLGDSLDFTESLPNPRFVKSHLPLELLPTELMVKKPKIIYIGRNPKDLCVSFYHYCQLVHQLSGSFEAFCDLFLAGGTPIGPVYPHMLSFWRKRHEPNILFLKYEDMKHDLVATVKKCAAFMEVKDLTEKDIIKLCDHLNFEKMQKNPAVNLEPLLNFNDNETKPGMKFIRKGQIGDWKNYMSPEISERFDEWIKRNSKDTGLSFDEE